MEFEGKNKKSNKKAQRAVTITCMTIIGVIVIGFAGYGIWRFAGDFKLPNDGDDKVTSTTEPEVTTTVAAPLFWWEDPEISELLELSFDSSYTGNDDLHNGDLILINPQYNYLGDSSSVASIFDNRGEAKYAAKDRATSLRLPVINQFNQMMIDFTAATGLSDIVVISGFRTKEYQQELYANGDPNLVAKPGYSEHETGYAVDISVQKNTIVDFDGTGEYAWIPEHAAEYGFILRYTAEKVGLTGIAYEPWHYRYVGIPHATYIKNNRLVLEEYINELRAYSFDTEHLFVPAGGKTYEIYFVPSNSAITSVPVYKNTNYTVSGNNVDGYIVTINRGEGYVPPVTTTTAPPTTTSETTLSE